MYQDIEKQLNAITDNMLLEMQKAKIIDKEYNVLDEKKFISFLTNAEKECNKLFQQVEKDGSTFDKYGANLIYARLDHLSNMKKTKAILPVEKFESKENLGDQTHNEVKTYKKGIFNLFRRKRNRIVVSNQNTKNL